MGKKGVAIGPRVTIGWGVVKRKVKGKSVTSSPTSRILKSTADAFGLKEVKQSTTTGARTKSITTKKGKRLILQGGTSVVAAKKMFASIDGKVWHQLPVPVGVSLAQAFAIFKGGKKTFAIKFQGGTPKVIGKASRDTKSKSKLATKTK